MTPKLVTFDAADTLIRVNWQPGSFAIACAREAGLQLDEQPAREMYDRLLRSRWGDYCAINQTRDPGQGDAFWKELTGDWLARQNAPETALDEVIAISGRRIYDCFELYADVEPALDMLKAQDIPVAVISNWDYSLHRILRKLGVYDRFDAVIASLEEGPEKPDPRLFQLVLDRFGVAADEAVHIGDNPLDDLEGARDVGMKALLLDRSRTEPSFPIISDFSQLEAALAWIG